MCHAPLRQQATAIARSSSHAPFCAAVRRNNSDAGGRSVPCTPLHAAVPSMPSRRVLEETPVQLSLVSLVSPDFVNQSHNCRVPSLQVLTQFAGALGMPLRGDAVNSSRQDSTPRVPRYPSWTLQIRCAATGSAMRWYFPLSASLCAPLVVLPTHAALAPHSWGSFKTWLRRGAANSTWQVLTEESPASAGVSTQCPCGNTTA